MQHGPHRPDGGQRDLRLGKASVGIALVDPIPLFRDGLSALVARTQGLHWVGAADGANAALQMCDRLRPDLVVLDSSSDPRNHLTHMIAGQEAKVGILVLVADLHRTTQYVASAIAAGAHGVILRTAEPSQLLDAIRQVHTDRRYVDPMLTPTIAAPRARTTSAQHPISAPQPLSRREFQVLQLIADGLENQAIAKILYVSVETVRTHVKSILRKLAARDRTHAVAVAFRTGVLTAGGDPVAARNAPSPADSAQRGRRTARD